MASEPLTTEELERIRRRASANTLVLGPMELRLAGLELRLAGLDAEKLLAEVARLEAEAKERLACEAGRAEERADVLSWLRGVGDQYMNGDMAPCDEFTGEAYHQAANEIEQGRHAAARQQGGG